MATQRRPGGPSAKVQDLLEGDDLQRHDIPLAADITVYSLDALPMSAGAKVLALGETGAGFVRVKFVTPGGRGLEGGAKTSDLGEELENGF